MVRTRKQILDDLEYARDRYRDLKGKVPKGDEKCLKDDIKELENELSEAGFKE
jgi:DNA-binding HxlR family transcriptional regulator